MAQHEGRMVLLVEVFGLLGDLFQVPDALERHWMRQNIWIGGAQRTERTRSQLVEQLKHTLGGLAGLAEVFHGRLVGCRFLHPQVGQQGPLTEALTAGNDALSEA